MSEPVGALASHAKSAWARLIRKVYEADPLECPKCEGPMRIIALIDDPPVVQRILEHLELWEPVSCYEAGRDGFWLHRHLRSVGIENEVIDAASIEVNRRLRHVKTDRLDGERLLSKLIRHHTGERGGWSVVRAPSVEDEDARRLHRELERLKRERLAHRVRMQSLLVVQGVRVRIKGAARLRLETLTLWDGRALPEELRSELEREIQRLGLVEHQIAALETERRERLREPKTEAERSIVQLMRLGAIGPTSAWLLVNANTACRKENDPPTVETNNHRCRLDTRRSLIEGKSIHPRLRCAA